MRPGRTLQPLTEPALSHSSPYMYPDPGRRYHLIVKEKQPKLKTLFQIGTVGTLVTFVHTLLPILTSSAYGHFELHWGRLGCYPEGGQGVIGHNVYCATCVCYFLSVSSFMILCYYAIYKKVCCHCHATVNN